MTDIQNTLAERGARYGDFSDHAAIAQKLQDVMRDFMRPGDPRTAWDMLSPVKRQALSVIADKIARILSGDPEYRGNWHDIAGYATLAHDRCVDTDGPELPLAEPVEEDGWIEWAGGNYPGDRFKDRVFYRLRDGSKNPYPRYAYELRWDVQWTVGDIVAYKVVE